MASAGRRDSTMQGKKVAGSIVVAISAKPEDSIELIYGRGKEGEV